MTTNQLVRAIAGAVTGLATIAALAACQPDTKTGKALANQPAHHRPAASTTAPAKPTATHAPKPAATHQAPKPQHTAPPAQQYVAVTYHGTGSDVLPIRKPGKAADPVLATITGPAVDDNFIVKGGQDQLLVNAIGAYTGTVVLDAEDGQETSRLIITASGPWSVRLAPLSDAPDMSNGRFSGHGSGVFIYRGDAAALTFSETGDDNFIVQAYGSSAFDDGTGLLVNEIGNYHGTVPIAAGPVLVAVQADGGTWSAAVSG